MRLSQGECKGTGNESAARGFLARNFAACLLALDETQRRVLDYYKEGGAYYLNTFLRAGAFTALDQLRCKPEGNPPWVNSGLEAVARGEVSGDALLASWAEALEAVTSAGRFGESCVAWRGLALHEDDPLAARLARGRGAVEEPGFASVSLLRHQGLRHARAVAGYSPPAWLKRFLLRVEVPAGAPGCATFGFLGPDEYAFDSDAEVVLPRGSLFELKGARSFPDGYTEVGAAVAI